MSIEKSTKLVVFYGKQIIKTLHDGEWWFSIIDVIEVMLGGDRPRKYWNDLKKKLLLEGYDQLSEKIGQLDIETYEKNVRLKITKSLSEKSINSIFPNEPQRTQRARRFFKHVSVFSVLSVVLTFRIGSKRTEHGAFIVDTYRRRKP